MIRFFLKLLGMPDGASGKSGKREVAAMLALFTAALIVWGFWGFDQSGRISILAMLISASLVALGGAFGLDALIRQGGVSWKNNKDKSNDDSIDAG